MIRHFSAFSGVGGASSALRQAGIPYQTIAISEVNKHALAIRNSIHPQKVENIGDITCANWDHISDLDLFSGGFPCQPFSAMGSMKGFKDPRVKAMFAMRDMILDTLPKYVLLENVGGILHKKNREGLNRFLSSFYPSYLLPRVITSNPNDLGWFQSRTRVFICLSRIDQLPWEPRFTKTNIQTWRDVVDSNPDPKHFFKIKPKSRIKIVVSDNSKKFECITKKSINAHCGRASWIQHGDGFRSPTTKELFHLFGYDPIPQIEMGGLISRSSFSMAMGNSWHVGHVANLLKSFPQTVGA